MNIQVFNEIDSTQIEAKRQIDAVGFIADKIIVAVNQTNGITTKKGIPWQSQAGDVLMILNFNIFDLDYYQFNGKSGDVSQGWMYNTSDPDTGDPIQELVNDPTQVVLPAGQGGYLQPGDGGNRTWTVSL